MESSASSFVVGAERLVEEVKSHTSPKQQSKFAIAPPAHFISPELESPNGPFDLYASEERVSPCHSPKPAWDMDTLKRSICSARTGTGDVRRIIETCTFKPREQAFTTLINMCGQLRDWQRAVEVFDAMQSVRGVKSNMYTYSALIAACSSAGEWVHALEFFEQMKAAAQTDPNCAPNEVTYSSVITACERGGQFEKALAIYDEMVANKVQPDHITYSSVLSACEKSKNWACAEKLLAEMHGRGLTGNAVIYSELLLYYAEQGNWSKALSMCLTMQTAGQDPTEGSRKVRGRQKGRQNEAMVSIPSPPQSVIHSPKETTPRPRTSSASMETERQDSGVCPVPTTATPSPTMRPPWDMETLKRAICFAKTGTGEVSRALETCTFRPREQAFTALINMCGRLRDWQKAVEVFEAMKAVRGVMPNTYTYSALIAACSSSGEWERALAVFEAMKVNAQVDQACVPNEVTYSALITACQRGGMFERALELYDEMLRSGVKPDHITYSSVLAACEKSERWERVEEILDIMHSQGLCGPQTVYTELINHYAEYGAYSKALQVNLAVQMLGHQPDDNMKRALMHALEKGEQYEMMFDLFKDMQKTGMPIDPEVLNSVLRAQEHVRRQGVQQQQPMRHAHPVTQQQQQQQQLSVNRCPPFYTSGAAEGVRNHQAHQQQQLIRQFQDMNVKYTSNRRDGRVGF